MTGVRSGPLGDGSPLTANDTELTLQYLETFASSLNLTEGEKEVFEALSQDKESLIEMLNSIRLGVDSVEDIKAEVIEARNKGEENFKSYTFYFIWLPCCKIGFHGIFLQTPALKMETKPSQAKTRKQMKNSKVGQLKGKEKVLRGNQHRMMITNPKTAILTS